MILSSMNPEIARKLLRVGEAFRIPGPFFSYEEIKMGNVNHTYKVNYVHDDGTGMAQMKSYLVQQVNTYAFQHPIELMQNIDRVTEYIRRKRPERENLHYHHTRDGLNYLLDEDGVWRLSNYVPSVTFDSCDDLRVVRSAGKAFGEFQMMLADFDASQLYYTIPDFHNTRKRYQQLKAAAAADPCGRLKAVTQEMDWLLAMEEEACRPEESAECCRHSVQKFFICDNVPFPPLLEKLRKIPGLFLTQSGVMNIEVMPAGVDKGQGLRDLAARLGVPMDRTMALGDAENDLAMLTAAAYGTAMGNASPAAKAAAKYHTDGNNEGGWAKAVIRFVDEMNR